MASNTERFANALSVMTEGQLGAVETILCAFALGLVANDEMEAMVERAKSGLEGLEDVLADLRGRLQVAGVSM